MRQLCSECGSRVCHHFEPTQALTPRERQIVEMLGRGLTNCEIAQILGLGTPTIKVYNHNLFMKLGLTSRLEVALWGLANKEAAPQRDTI